MPFMSLIKRIFEFLKVFSIYFYSRIKRSTNMYLGIDLGTSCLKVALVDEEGQVQRTVSRSFNVSRPHSLWSEQNPEDWVHALNDAMLQLGENCDLKQVVAMGLSGQMHGAVILDENYKPLRPAILWNDGRSMQECRELELKIPQFRKKSGNLAMPGFTAPKIMWIARHEPDNFLKMRKVCLPKDYLRLHLTGTLGTDISDASGTLWLNPRTREWDPELSEVAGMTSSKLPAIQLGNQTAGTLRYPLAERWGMKRIVIAAGAGDNAASAVGMGLITPMKSLISVGTSGVYLEVRDTHVSDPDQAVHDFCHTLEGLWTPMAVTLSAASSLDWFAKIAHLSVEEMVQNLEYKGRTESKVLFTPYLTGERTPHNNPHLRASFKNLSMEHSSEDCALAIMEGVAFSIKEGIRAISTASDPSNPITIVGGGSRSSLWCQIFADVVGRPIELIHNSDHAAALGAALLGRSAQESRPVMNMTKKDKEDITVYTPIKCWNDYYEEKFCDYQSIVQKENKHDSF